MKSERKLRDVIVKELRAVADKYGKERMTTLVYDHEDAPDEEPDVPDYPVTVFVSREGYFKKITPQSLRMASEQKFKEGDGLLFSQETSNNQELLVFTDKCQVYKCRLSDFEDSKASVLGEYLAGKLGFDEGESFLTAVLPGDYQSNILFVFENGKAAKVALAGYETKTNRKRLTGAYSDKSPIRAILPLCEDAQIALYASDGRCLIFSTAQIAVKTTRATQGVAVMALKKRLSCSAPFRWRRPASSTSPATARGRFRQRAHCCARRTARRNRSRWNYKQKLVGRKSKSSNLWEEFA